MLMRSTLNQPCWNLVGAGSKEISWSWICSTFPEHWSGCWIGWIGGGRALLLEEMIPASASYTRADLRGKLTLCISDLCCSNGEKSVSVKSDPDSRAPNKFRNPVALFTSYRDETTWKEKSFPRTAMKQGKGKGLVHPSANAKMNNNDKNQKQSNQKPLDFII